MITLSTGYQTVHDASLLPSKEERAGAIAQMILSDLQQGTKFEVAALSDFAESRLWSEWKNFNQAMEHFAPKLADQIAYIQDFLT